MDDVFDIKLVQLVVFQVCVQIMLCIAQETLVSHVFSQLISLRCNLLFINAREVIYDVFLYTTFFITLNELGIQRRFILNRGFHVKLLYNFSHSFMNQLRQNNTSISATQVYNMGYLETILVLKLRHSYVACSYLLPIAEQNLILLKQRV